MTWFQVDTNEALNFISFAFEPTLALWTYMKQKTINVKTINVKTIDEDYDWDHHNKSFSLVFSQAL